MMRDKIFIMVFIIFLFAITTSNCIDFREWDKDNYFEQDINNKGLPIAIFTDVPYENETNNSEKIFEDPSLGDFNVSTTNSKRLLGFLHESVLEKISFNIPDGWTTLREDLFWSPSYSLTLNVYTFQEDTNLEEVYYEYRSFIEQLVEISRENVMVYEDFPLDNNAIMGVFEGVKNENGDSWAGIIFILSYDSYPYLFMWDALNSENADAISEEFLSVFDVIDSIKPSED